MLRWYLYTIGHSNRELGELLDLLHQYGIELVVDVRRFPTSKKYPHFRRDNLSCVLPRVGVEYCWLGDLLGGYRSGGYEAFTTSETFRTGLELLLQLASRRVTAVMCAERLFFRCHRRFIADACLSLGWRVWHIVEPGRLSRHKGRLLPDGQLELELKY